MAAMKQPKPSKSELRILEVLWNHGASSIREIQERFPEKNRPAYTTVQTLVYRLEAKKALRRVKAGQCQHVRADRLPRCGAAQFH
jgi:BlaI family penicillinase repressor